jgi:mannose-6-phosphate isomerase-like protein (cupin superfamily)
MDESIIKRDWQSRGFSCDIWTDPPSQAWQDYVHGVDELLMLIDGEIEVRLDGKILRPATGEEIFIPANALHTVINVGSVTNHWFYGYRIK